MKKTKPSPDKNHNIPKEKDLTNHVKNADDIFQELEIPERTQKPPSAELIARLNDMASKPPFSYHHKAKGNDTR